MIGDRLLINDYHRDGARQIWTVLQTRLQPEGPCVAVTIAGESGSGKSEIAQCLAELVREAGHTCLLLAQDDYFRLPPRSNHERRKQGLEWVGPGEVRLDLLDTHIAAVKSRPGAPFEKPLVHFDENRIATETVPAEPRGVVIAEGTYTTLLKNADLRAFIDRTYEQNRANRLKRARDPDPVFLEEVLAIEHAVIAEHRAMAEIVLPAPADERGL